MTAKRYIHDAAGMRCPGDPDSASNGYADFYVLRAVRDSDELPIVVCPYHEEQGQHGAQAFKGRYTGQFSSRTAVLQSAVDTTVQRPGQNPVAGSAGQLLHGGDTVRTGAGGMATIEFADGNATEGPSTSVLAGGSVVRLLESYREGHAGQPIYSLVKELVGSVSYRVHRGSKFDISTPTATAGALGTAFVINVTPGEVGLSVTQSKVRLNNRTQELIVVQGRSAACRGNGRNSCS